jgi:hypothetical protein
MTASFFDAISEDSYVYLALLALHLASLVIFGGTIFVTHLSRLGLGMTGYSTEELVNELRLPRRFGFAVAVLSGALMFGSHAGPFSRDPWFRTKMALLILIGVNSLLFRRNAKPAAAVSLLLWAGVICAGRGPATVRDVMHSTVDPAGDAVFESVRQVADEHGLHEKAPRTDAEWEDVRRHLAILMHTPDLVDGRRAARMRDRSGNPRSESQPEDIQNLLDADHANLIRRARKLQAAAATAMKAVDAKDKDALFRSIDGIDKACENCHLHYWYPNDKRAQQAAIEDGVDDF